MLQQTKETCVGARSQQRAPMWLKLNIYHVLGQWVTYFWEYSSIRLKIYYPSPPAHPSAPTSSFPFVLADVKQALAFQSLFLFSVLLWGLNLSY